jgi:nucleoside-diphosphate-sugar epimerase
LMETAGLKGEVVNLGNPIEITVRQFAEAVIEVTNSPSEIVLRPLPVDDPTRRQPDISKAKRLLGWEPTVDLRAGLQLTVAYFASLR